VEPDDPAWREVRTELLSNHIAGLVSERIRLVAAERLSETLAQHLADLDARSKAGILFEHAAHFAIRQPVMLNMFRLSASTRRKLDMGKKVDMTIPAVGNNEKSRYYSLDIQESPDSQNVHPDFLGLYTTPVIKTEPSIDALFISSGYTIYLFQMTVICQYYCCTRKTNGARYYYEMVLCTSFQERILLASLMIIAPEVSTNGSKPKTCRPSDVPASPALARPENLDSP